MRKHPSHSRGEAGIQNDIKLLSRRCIKLMVLDAHFSLFHSFGIGHDWSWSIGFHPAGSRLASKGMYRAKPFLHGDTMVNINRASSVNFAHKDPRRHSKTATLPSAVWIWIALTIGHDMTAQSPFEFNPSRARRVNSSSGA